MHPLWWGTEPTSHLRWIDGYGYVEVDEPSKVDATDETYQRPPKPGEPGYDQWFASLSGAMQAFIRMG